MQFQGKRVMSQYILAFDVGGTNLRAAVVEDSGAIVFQDRRPTEVEQGLEALEAKLIGWGRELIERAEADSRGDLRTAAPRC